MHSDEEETRREVAFLRAMAAYRRYKLLARLAYPAALVTAVATAASAAIDGGKCFPMTATEHDEARSTAASWLVTALAGIALTGGLAISTYAARTAHEALEATIRFEERDYLRIRDLPHHIVPAAETG